MALGTEDDRYQTDVMFETRKRARNSYTSAASSEPSAASPATSRKRMTASFRGISYKEEPYDSDADRDFDGEKKDGDDCDINGDAGEGGDSVFFRKVKKAAAAAAAPTSSAVTAASASTVVGSATTMALAQAASTAWTAAIAAARVPTYNMCLLKKVTRGRSAG